MSLLPRDRAASFVFALSLASVFVACGDDATSPASSSVAGAGGNGGAAQAGSAGGAGRTSGGGAGSAGSLGGGAGAAGKAGSGNAGTAGQPSAGTGGAAGQTSAGTGGTAGQTSAGTGGGAGNGAAGAAGQTSAGTGGGAGNGAAGAAGQASTSGRWLMAYYPGYQRGDLPEADIRFDRLTHLAVGAVLPKNGGDLDTQFYLGAETGPAFALALAQRTHQAGKKAILMVGGAGAHDGFVDAASPANRAKLVTNLVQFAKANDFDGLDLDWEPLPASELPAFGELAKALRAAWPEAILTLPITPLNVNFESADPAFGTIAASLDQINVMTYSMAGAYEGWQSWHHTPLRGHTASTPMSVESSVDSFLAAGVSPAKLGIGEGFYGLCYTAPVTGPRQALGGAQAIADDNALSYRTLLSTYLPAATKQWDDIAKAPYLTFGAPTGPQQCTYLSYVDEQAIGEHTAYIKAKGLGGAIVWTIGEGHLASGDDRDPLLGALWNGIK